MAKFARSGILLAVFVGLATACHTVRFDLSDTSNAQVVQKRNHFWFWGLSPGNREVDVGRVCPAGAAAIRERTSFVDGLISLVTFGIYETRTAWYYCLPGRGNG